MLVHQHVNGDKEIELNGGKKVKVVSMSSNYG